MTDIERLIKQARAIEAGASPTPSLPDFAKAVADTLESTQGFAEAVADVMEDTEARLNAPASDTPVFDAVEG